MRRSAGGIEPPTNQFEVTANSLPAKKRRGRKSNADSGFEPGHGLGVSRSSCVLTTLEIKSEEKAADGMKIPPPGRCRPGQGLNLQLLSFDKRVYRSNRPLTASEIDFWEKIRRSSPGALPAFHFRSRQALVFAAMVRARHGVRFGAKYLHLHCPEKESQEKTDQRQTCSTH